MQTRLRSIPRCLFVCICVWGTVCSWTGFAQVTTGTISGTVTDASGAVVAGAAIAVRHTETGLARTVVSDAGGRYRVPQLPLGDYEVEASMAGFQTELRKGITLTVGREAVVNVALQVGAVTERVEVTGEAPLVQTTDSTISYLVDEKTMRDLPLNGRSYTQLAILQPNVVPVTLYNKNISSGTGLNLSIQGQRQSQNLFLLDGTEANDYSSRTPAGAVGNSLGVEAIREFSLLTGLYSAEYGHFMGGVLNMVTRSGTNAFHGNLFEFLRNSALDAKNFFDSGTLPIPPFRRNQFGATAGGPLRKDRAFFFGAYEGLRELKTLTDLQTVPNAAAHRGILPSGPVTINPAIQPLVDALPLPTGRDFGDGTGELIVARGQANQQDYFMIRTDYQISDSHSLFGRYTFDDSKFDRPESPPVFRDIGAKRNQWATLSETSLFGPTVLNVFRVGFTRTSGNGFTTDLASFPPGYTFLSGAPKVGPWQIRTPALNVGACPSCRREDPRTFIMNAYDVNDKLTLQRGPHSLSFGGTVKRYQLNEFVISGASNLGFPVFNALTDFLQGRAASFAAARPEFADFRRGLRGTLFGLFVQDDFRIHSNLTFNLGLRWEMSTSPTEVNGKMSLIRNPLTDTSLTIPDALTTTTKKNFGPRVGFAWDPFSKGKTSVRGGVGIFYDIIIPYEYPWGLSIASQPPYAQVVTLTSNIQLPRPFDAPGVNLAGRALDAFTLSPETKASARYFWTFGIQQEVVSNTVVSATYSGSRSAHLGMRADINISMPTPDAAGQPFFAPGLLRRNPAFGAITSAEYGTNSFYHALAVNVNRRLARGFQGQAAYTFSKNIDEISALFSGGPGAPEATNAGGGIQNIDNRAADRGLSAFDLRQSFVVNTSWELPFGKHSGVAGKALEGWQFNTILTRSTGLPFTPTVGFLRSRSTPTGAGADRPNLAPGRSNNPVRGGPDQYFDPTAFELQPAGYFGNLGKATVSGPGRVNLDLALRKNTALRERMQMEFRAEFFNILNHPNFGSMNIAQFQTSGARTGNAGRVVDTINDSRQIQFGLKLLF